MYSILGISEGSNLIYCNECRKIVTYDPFYFNCFQCNLDLCGECFKKHYGNDVQVK